jgi:hypothetical protein
VFAVSSRVRKKCTLIHKDARVGNRLSSKFMTVRFSAGTLRFLGVAGFLNGSAPDSLAHLWQRKPGPEFAAIVYFVCRRIKDVNIETDV